MLLVWGLSQSACRGVGPPEPFVSVSCFSLFFFFKKSFFFFCIKLNYLVDFRDVGIPRVCICVIVDYSQDYIIHRGTTVSCPNSGWVECGIQFYLVVDFQGAYCLVWV